ncbi:MAG: caspase family protein [Chitinophagales bacterium]
MNKFLFLFLTLSIIQANAQYFKPSSVFNENFGNNNNHWKIDSFDTRSYATYIKDGKFHVNLPDRNQEQLNQVVVRFPSRITVLMDADPYSSLELEWSVSETPSFSFSILFDILKDESDRSNTNFYRSLCFSGHDKMILTSLNQKVFKSDKEEVVQTGDMVPVKSVNKLRIVKENYTWTIFVNDWNVMSFQYQGQFNSGDLVVGRGHYIFDNIQVNQNRFEIIEETSDSYESEDSSEESVKGANTNISYEAQLIEDTAVPKIYVLIAAIEDYRFQKPLRYTVDDAQAMYDFWISPNGGRIPKERIVLLLDSNARHENILNAANKLFRLAGKNDLIITFLSGHGNVGSFITFNGDMQYAYLERILKKSKALRKICIIDACHSGSVSCDKFNLQGGRVMSDEDAIRLFYSAIRKSAHEITYLLACRADELSQERKDLGHGVFTYYLLEALKGAADMDKNSLISLEEAYLYLRMNVPVKSPEQNPMIKGMMNPETPLSVTIKRK